MNFLVSDCSQACTVSVSHCPHSHTNKSLDRVKKILRARRIGTMQLNGLTRLLDTWADRPVKLLYLLNARALPLRSKLSGGRQSK
jgi:hypothetical protein